MRISRFCLRGDYRLAHPGEPLPGPLATPDRPRRHARLAAGTAQAAVGTGRAAPGLGRQPEPAPTRKPGAGSGSRPCRLRRDHLAA